MKRGSGKVTQGIKMSTVIGLLSVVILLSAAGVGSFVSYINGRDALATQTLQLNEYHAQELARIGTTSIANMQRSLAESASYAMSMPLTPEMTQSNLDYFRKSSGFFNSVVIIDASGILTYSSPNLGITDGRIKTPQLLQALSAKIPTISVPYIAPTGRYLVTVSEPLFSTDGVYQGILAGSIYLKEENRLGEILGTQSPKGDGSYFYVIDDSGKYIYHPDERLIGKEITDQAIQDIFSSGGVGSSSIVQSDGNRYLAGHASIDQTGWCVIFQTPYENVVQAAKLSTFETSLYMLPGIVLVLLLTLYVSHKLSMPLYTLARYIEHMANRRAPEEVPNVQDWNYETKMLKEAILLAENKTREAEAFLLKEANHDPLTGLLNRRTLEGLTNEWMQQNKKFYIVFLDIDYFKSINDTYGHQKGDEVLKKIAMILSEQVGLHGHCFRYGGEEFVILLSHDNEAEAFALAEQIRFIVELSEMPVPQKITISLGVAARDQEVTADRLFEKADHALYEAKESGRNQSVLVK
ncbi:sensor domain-containing diguanylate cyclase [Saccharibacillus sp. JS10]|uniref:sensor domain-containing diguanylate cyclase n=1 Tax=Saccharibacillus sp. JS10 TaxID=2950552 RepID=UPI00210D235D|nr:sensor domain-containing diguanylate cyclase [Saccharibacillus sp. JS10]MCQ4086081.1 sensor domain-containing diguanylate cyclase [Saccharibacillus sp. JS10]